MTPEEAVELRAEVTRLEDYLRAARQRIAALEAENRSLREKLGCGRERE